MFHLLLHLILPLIVARLFFSKHWLKVYFIFMLTMLVDIDHLLASPIYDPNRCSINFHPLHTYWAIAVYVVGLCFRPTRLVSIGLLIHMALDWQDCRLPIKFWFE
ncbi:DUF6122 family protein [Aliikangiella sp. IMCC44632]